MHHVQVPIIKIYAFINKFIINTLYRKSNKKKQEGQLEVFKTWSYLSKSLESENRFKFGFCPAPSVWTHKLFRFRSFLLLCLGYCSETNWGLKGGRVGTHTLEMLVPQTWAHLGKELFQEALWQSPTSLSLSLLEKTALPGAFPSEQSSPTALSSYTYLTIPLKQGWCFMLGHYQRNRSSWLLTLFFLASEPAKFKSES